MYEGKTKIFSDDLLTTVFDFNSTFIFINYINKDSLAWIFKKHFNIIIKK